jgi:hypothetical protein
MDMEKTVITKGKINKAPFTQLLAGCARREIGSHSFFQGAVNFVKDFFSF